MKIPKCKIEKLERFRKVRRKLLALVLLVIVIGTSYRIWEYISPSKTAEAAWYDPGYSFRRKFVVNHLQVSGTTNFTNFHVLVGLDIPDFKNALQSDADDLVFTSTDGVTKYDHEIESYNSSTGQLIAWVEIPTLYAESDTVFYMYYGNPAATNQQNVGGMWGGNFKAVWHFSQDPASGNGEVILDSTQYDNDGDLNGPSSTGGDRVAGQVGYALSFDGTSDYMTVADAPSNSLNFGTDDFTVLFWNRMAGEVTAVSSGELLFGKTDGSFGNDTKIGYGFVYREDSGDCADCYQLRLSDGHDGQPVNPAWQDNINSQIANYDDPPTWNNIAVRVDRDSSSGNAYYYINGVEGDVQTAHRSANNSLDVTDDLAFCTPPFNVGVSIEECGAFDEMWIIGVDTGSDFISTVFNNQSNNSTFYSEVSIPERRHEPRAHWKMDEGSGSTIYDAVGESNNGTATNTTWETVEANCVMGKCLTFGTTDNRVTVSDHIDLDFAAGMSFTLEAWIKHNTASAQQVIVSKYNEAGYKLLMESDGDITCGIDFDSSWSPAFSVTSTLATYDDNNWHHVVCVKNANTNLTLYIDGVSVGTPATSLTNSTLANSDPLYIGIDADASSLDWVGSIDEVKLYDYARSTQEILTDYNIGFSSSGSNAVLGRFSTNLPVSSTLHWKFDEANNTTAFDAAPSTTSNGTVSGASWLLPTYCKANNCLSFDGSNDAVTITQAADSEVDFNGSEAFSMSLWVYPTTMPGSGEQDALIAKWDATGTVRGYRLYLENDDADTTGNFEVSVYDESTDQTISASTANDFVSQNTWYHVLFTFNGGTTGAAGDLVLYVNGVSMGSNAQNASFLGLEDVTSDFTVGEYDSGDAVATNTAFHGYLDELRVYASALTVPSVKVDYNFDAAVNFGTGAASESASIKDGPPASLVGYWPLDENTNDTCSGGSNDVCDRSGNGRDGAKTGWVENNDWHPGKFGAALNFTATDTEYIEIGNGPSDIDTITFWVKPTSTTDEFINLNSTTVYISASSGTVGLAGQVGETVYVNGVNGATITANVWNHVAVITASSINASSGDIEIGRVAGGTYADAAIDEVKLFSTALTQAQVAYDYNRGKPLGWWRFDEQELNWCGTSTDGCDASGFGYDLLAQANATTVSVPGKFSNGLELDGTGDYYCADDDDNGTCDPDATTKLQLVGDLTVSGWINFDAATDSATIVYQGENGSETAANNELYFLRLDTTSGTDIEYGHESGTGTDNYQIFDVNFSINTWYHITLVRDVTANSLRLFLNGVQVGAVSSYTGDPSGGSTGEFAIGANDNGTNNWDGTLDEIRVYNYAMSTQQVKQLYTNGSARFD